MPDIQHKRGTRAALNALATANGLLPGQIYVLTDEARIAVATSANTYQTFLKEGEAGSTLNTLDLTSESPSAPPANTVRLFRRQLAGRSLPAYIGPSGLASAIQGALHGNKTAIVSPSNNATTPNVLGLEVSAVGSGTAANVNSTNFYQSLVRTDYLVTTPSTTAVAGVRVGSNQWWRGNAPKRGGFFFRGRWGPATGVAIATHRGFFGLAPSAAPTDVDPSSRFHILGMGWDSGDANISFMHNDNVGSATKVSLGASFPRPNQDRTNVYELAMFCQPNGSEVSWQVTDVETDAVATGTATADLPLATTFLAFLAAVSVGGTSSVVGLSLMGLYVETDY